jgi:trk system potassium uptake protein TrkH
MKESPSSSDPSASREGRASSPLESGTTALTPFAAPRVPLLPHDATTGSPARALGGLLVAVAPWVYGFASEIYRFRWADALAGSGSVSTLSQVLPFVAAVVAVSLLAVGGATLGRLSLTGRIAASLGILGSIGLFVPALKEAPAAALIAAVIALLILHLLWPRRGSERRYHDSGSRSLAFVRAAGLVSGGIWLAVAAIEGGAPSSLAAEGAASLLIAGIAGASQVPRAVDNVAPRAIGIAATIVTLLAVVVSVSFSATSALHVGAIGALFLSFGIVRRDPSGEPTWGLELVLGHPGRFLVTTFFALSTVIGILLALPFCSRRGDPLSPMDATFTAVSGVCVTGLSVIDIGRDLSPVGQIVLLVGIQLGGLGIMTFSTIGLQLLGRRMSLKHESAVASLLSVVDRSQLFHSTRRIVYFTFGVEAIGAAILTLFFAWLGDGFASAAWRGVFTSVSAFCNSGFALDSQSLIPHQTHTGILHTVGVLIILGGLSPVAALAIRDGISGRRIGMQQLLIYWTTGGLLVVGFLFISAFEWTNTLEGLSFFDRLQNAWFQSVTLRTAGFNSIDISLVQPATLALMLVWMFIGGSPGGTAGGIKTTTIAVLVLAAVSALRGHSHADAFGRKIAHRSIYRAAAVSLAGVASFVVAYIAIEMTQAMTSREACFEVVSALGTVGLSVGGTGKLDDLGKVVIILCMFLGRVGPSALFLFLSQRSNLDVWQHPEQEIDVG